MSTNELRPHSTEVEFPPDPTTEDEIPAYVDACWSLSIWARAFYRTKENAVKQLTGLMRREKEGYSDVSK